MYLLSMYQLNGDTICVYYCPTFSYFLVITGMTHVAKQCFGVYIIACYDILYLYMYLHKYEISYANKVLIERCFHKYKQ